MFSYKVAYIAFQILIGQSQVAAGMCRHCCRDISFTTDIDDKL